MIYDITHRCGHSEIHDLWGRHTRYGGLPALLAWLPFTPCSECRRTEDVYWHAAEAASEPLKIPTETTKGTNNTKKYFVISENLSGFCLQTP